MSILLLVGPQRLTNKCTACQSISPELSRYSTSKNSQTPYIQLAIDFVFK